MLLVSEKDILNSITCFHHHLSTDPQSLRNSHPSLKERLLRFEHLVLGGQQQMPIWICNAV